MKSTKFFSKKNVTMLILMLGFLNAALFAIVYAKFTAVTPANINTIPSLDVAAKEEVPVEEEPIVIDPVEMEKILKNFYYAMIPNKQLVDLVFKYNKGRLSYDLIFATVWRESRFNPKAFNDNGETQDYGWFQLNSKTYKNYKAEELLDPETNVRLGLDHLVDVLIRSKGDSTVALWMYNAGLKLVREGKVKTRTKTYAQDILSKKKEYEAQIEQYTASFSDS